MALSVVITSYNSPATLRRCLTSITQQPEADEVIVADCSPRDPALDLAAEFPRVRFLHFSGKRTVPELRWAAVRAARGEVIAVTEARCVPLPGWCRELAAAHAQAPDAPVVGGPVDLRLPAGRPDAGLYFCEYGRFAPPAEEGDVTELSLANLAYKRRDLDAEQDLLAESVWDCAIHRRWLEHGRRLRMCTATIVFENSMDVPAMFRQRFHYGRGYAAERTRDASLAIRLLYAAATPLLPVVLTWRIVRAIRRTASTPPPGNRGAGRRLPGMLARAFHWVVVFNTAWAAGELAGYLGGKPAEPQIF